MGFSLKGIVTGFATAASEMMDEERKQTNSLIAQRTKNSFENYTKYQETTEALRADIKKKDAQLLNFQPDLTEQERVAAASIPNLVDMYQRMLTEGKQVTVRDMIKVSEKTAGMKFDSYVSEIGKITPTTEAAAPVSSAFFAPSEESQRKTAEKYATATGVSEADLRSFQQMPKTAGVESMGGINVDVFKKEKPQPKSVEDAYNESRVQMMLAEKNKGKDSPEFKAAETNFKLANSYLEAAPESLSKRADRIRVSIIDEPDVNKKKQLTAELNTVEKSIKAHTQAISTKEAGDGADKKKTYAQIKASVNDFVNTRMRDEEGASWRKYVDFKTTKMEDGTTFVSRTQKADMPIEEQRKMFATERNLTQQGLFRNGYVSKDGVPLYSAVSEIMSNMNIPVGPMIAPPLDVNPVVTPAAAPAPAAMPSKPATLGSATAGRNAAPVANIPSFRTVEEAEAAKLPKGTKITIGGRAAEVQ